MTPYRPMRTATRHPVDTRVVAVRYCSHPVRAIPAAIIAAAYRKVRP